MRSPWRKQLRDLWLHLPRTLMVISALSIGLFSVGSVLDAYFILQTTIAGNFAMTHPASATLRMDAVDSVVVAQARRFPAIQAAEARRTVATRIQLKDGSWVPMILFVIQDYHRIQIKKVWPVSGSWPPHDQQLLIERSSIPLLHAGQGDTLTLRPRDGTPHAMQVSGIAFDPGQAPAWVEGMAYGYITPDTYRWLTGKEITFNDLLLIVAGDPSSAHIREVAGRFRASLEQNGRTVRTLTAGKREHPHAGLMMGLMFLLEAFAMMCLLLSGVLSATLISALMSQQIRQIGVMKAVGARSQQIMNLYLGSVLLLAGIALVIAIPFGALAGRVYARSAAGLLNFNVLSEAIPFRVILAQVALGIAVPLLAAMLPVFRGSRITVREAISDYGADANPFGARSFDALLLRVSGSSRPLVLSLRNSFRRRGRMALTLLMLTAAGASFITALGSTTSLNRIVEKIIAAHPYDLDLRFEHAFPTAALEQSIRSVPGVKRVEMVNQVDSAGGTTMRALVFVRDHAPRLQTSVSQGLEKRLTADGFPLASLSTRSTQRQGLDNHLILLQALLLAVSVLLAAVGALGLASTMSLHVLERTREIGTMRAVGASTATILRIVLVEGIVIGGLSGVLSCTAALPLTVLVVGGVARIFLNMPMALAIPLWIPLFWMALVLGIAVAASLYPAWCAARLTVRAALAQT